MRHPAPFLLIVHILLCGVVMTRAQDPSVKATGNYAATASAIASSTPAASISPVASPSPSSLPAQVCSLACADNLCTGKVGGAAACTGACAAGFIPASAHATGCTVSHNLTFVVLVLAPLPCVNIPFVSVDPAGASDFWLALATATDMHPSQLISTVFHCFDLAGTSTSQLVLGMQALQMDAATAVAVDGVVPILATMMGAVSVRQLPVRVTGSTLGTIASVCAPSCRTCVDIGSVQCTSCNGGSVLSENAPAPCVLSTTFATTSGNSGNAQMSTTILIAVSCGGGALCIATIAVAVMLYKRSGRNAECASGTNSKTSGGRGALPMVDDATVSAMGQRAQAGKLHSYMRDRIVKGEEDTDPWRGDRNSGNLQGARAGASPSARAHASDSDSDEAGLSDVIPVPVARSVRDAAAAVDRRVDRTGTGSGERRVSFKLLRSPDSLTDIESPEPTAFVSVRPQEDAGTRGGGSAAGIGPADTAEHVLASHGLNISVDDSDGLLQRRSGDIAVHVVVSGGGGGGRGVSPTGNRGKRASQVSRTGKTSESGNKSSLIESSDSEGGHCLGLRRATGTGRMNPLARMPWQHGARSLTASDDVTLNTRSTPFRSSHPPPISAAGQGGDPTWWRDPADAPSTSSSTHDGYTPRRSKHKSNGKKQRRSRSRK